MDLQQCRALESDWGISAAADNNGQSGNAFNGLKWPNLKKNINYVNELLIAMVLSLFLRINFPPRYIDWV